VTVQSFLRPASVDEALSSFGRAGVAVLAGGTIVMQRVAAGDPSIEQVVSLDRAGLDGIATSGGRVRLGAMVRLQAVRDHPELAFLHAAVDVVGGPAIRNMATVGGNLFARQPYGDLGTMLLALDAEIELAAASGRATVPLERFYADHRRTSLVLSVGFTAPAAGTTAFLKFARRQTNTGAVVVVAAQLPRDASGNVAGARVALGGLGPVPVRAPGAERALEGAALDGPAIEAAAAAALEGIEPRDDAYASAAYRRRMIPVQVRRALAPLAG
jgi:probable selenate reductase FAD-binding subunit